MDFAQPNQIVHWARLKLSPRHILYLTFSLVWFTLLDWNVLAQILGVVGHNCKWLVLGSNCFHGELFTCLFVMLVNWRGEQVVVCKQCYFIYLLCMYHKQIYQSSLSQVFHFYFCHRDKKCLVSLLQLTGWLCRSMCVICKCEIMPVMIVWRNNV